MALPKNVFTIYSLTIPSTKQVVKFRQFNVGEQKALLLAQQSENTTVMIDTLKGVLKSCIMDPIDVSALATFDIDYMMLQIRAKSVGEIAELNFACTACHEIVSISFDLTKLEVTFDPANTKQIDLGNNMGIILKYPQFDVLKKMDKFDVSDSTAIFNVVADCIDFIWEGEQIFHAAEHTRDELNKFIDGLSESQFAAIKTFFDTLPKLEQKVVFDCPKCKKHHDSVLKGIDSFF